MRLTLLNVFINIAEIAFRLVLLGLLDANAYAIVSRLTTIPVNVLFVAYCYREIFRRAVTIWPADMEPPSRGDGGESRGREMGAADAVAGGSARGEPPETSTGAAPGDTAAGR